MCNEDLPLVTVITPCFNAEKTIRQTIESVINQSFEKWEMIIVDDCSTDNAASIIKKFVESDSRIKYYKTNCPSGSPSLPRNIALNKARGKYIAFLDADDIWLPNKLKVQINFIEDHNYDFIYSDYEKISAEGIRKNRTIRMPKLSSFWDVIETCTIPCLTVLMTRKIIGSTRFKMIPKEDFEFWLCILKKDVKAYNTGSVLALYREQDKSRSSNKLEMIKSQWRILREIEGVKPIIAFYFMIKYVFYGLLKYIK